MFLMKHKLDRHSCETYTRSTVVDGLSVLYEAVSLVNERRLSSFALLKASSFLSVKNRTKRPDR